MSLNKPEYLYMYIYIMDILEIQKKVIELFSLELEFFFSFTTLQIIYFLSKLFFLSKNIIIM
jgi:vesicle coat complex subunit